MKQDLRIALVGVGNLGWNLLQHLLEKGYAVEQVVSSKGKNALRWTDKLGVEIIPSVEKLNPDLDIIFLCLADDVLEEVASEIQSKGAIVHCSGSTPILDVKQKAGVFYPFQTFTKYYPVEWKGVPIFIESEDKALMKILLDLAEDLSGVTMKVSFDQRRSVHMSGVFGANFVNYILTLSKRILDDQNLKFELLEPLLYETMRKAFEHGPTGSQTGPARRGDKKLIEQHLELLENDKTLRDFYHNFSESILRDYQSKE